MAMRSPGTKGPPTLRFYNDLHAGYGTIRIHNYGDPFLQVFYKNPQTGSQSRYQYVVRDYPKGTFKQDIRRYIVEPQGFVQDMLISMSDSTPSPGMDRVAVILMDEDWDQPHAQNVLEGLLESIAVSRIVSYDTEGNMMAGGSECAKKNCSSTCRVFSYIILSGITGYTVIIRSDCNLDHVPFNLREVLRDDKCIVIGQDTQKDLALLERPYGSNCPTGFDTRLLIDRIIGDPCHKTFKGNRPFSHLQGENPPTGLGAQQYLITGEDHKP